MKVNFIVTVAALTLAVFLSVSIAQAEEKGTAEQSQHKGHDDTSAKEVGAMDGKGNMDMDQMMGMMHDCMKMHKDGKMCNHEMMNKCEEKMGKEDCEKMMKKMKPAKKKK